MNKNKNWEQQIQEYAIQWNHKIYKITTQNGKITRRCLVMWSCQNHPEAGVYKFPENVGIFQNFLIEKNIIESFSEEEIFFFVENYKGKTFYATRLDEYLRNSKKQPRTNCCAYGYVLQKKIGGYETFRTLLDRRGAHYNTTYTLLTPQENYKNKNTKCLIKCESHNEIVGYLLVALQGFTSCPCPKCRIDPNHKNRSVDRVRQINGRPGQRNRHHKRVLEK